MKITPVGNINFGYNHDLNDKVINRLKQNEELPLNQALLKMNSACNSTERAIKTLEKYGRRGTDKNEEQINLLSDYFVEAKLYFAKIINRLFPDLNYLKTECDTYDKEAMNISMPRDANDCIGTRKAYMWREMLVDKMIDEIENTCEYAPYDLKNPRNNTTTSINEEPSANAPTPAPKPNLNKTVLDLDNEDGGQFISKFTPESHSPKSLDDVVGLKATREDIEDLIIFPLENPESAKQRQEDYGIEIPHFIVFHGPPGCGKTMLSEAISAQTGCEMFKMDISKVGSSYVNKTANNIGKAFEVIFNAAQKTEKPVILFMDEMDSVLSKRTDATDGSKEDNKAVNTLLPLITSAKDKNVVIIGATNMYNLIDPAAKRRVELEAYIGLPDKKETGELIKKELEKIKMGQALAQNQEEIEKLSQELLGYSPSNIVSITKKASKNAYRAGREINTEDFEKALKEGSWAKTDEKKYLPENQQSKKNAIGFVNVE